VCGLGEQVLRRERERGVEGGEKFAPPSSEFDMRGVHIKRREFLAAEVLKFFFQILLIEFDMNLCHERDARSCKNVG